MTYYILQRAYPHYVGFLAYIPIADSICQIPITGHNIWLTFEGTIRGRFIPMETKVLTEILSVFHDMERWFYENRVQVDPKRFKRYIISAS